MTKISKQKLIEEIARSTGLSKATVVKVIDALSILKAKEKKAGAFKVFQMRIKKVPAKPKIEKRYIEIKDGSRLELRRVAYKKQASASKKSASAKKKRRGTRDPGPSIN